jgi:hypothetical protein
MRSAPQRRVRQLLTAVLSAYGFALGCRGLDEADTFFHLSLGRAVLREGSRIVPEPTAFVDFTAKAVASEWLWSVLSYAVFALGGYPLLVWLGCVLAAAACFSAASLALHTRDEAASPVLVYAIAVSAACAVIARSAVRPELALLIALPWYVIGARAYRSRPLLYGPLLAGSCVLWAQLHGSFVLCPAIFAICALDPRRLQLRTDGLVILLLLAAQLTSPYGANISELISSHAAGDAPRYIAEMARPTWAMLNPFEAPLVAAYFALLGFGAAGMLIERRGYVRELLLALLGAALFATANRFLVEAVLLAVPFANQGARALTQHLRARSLDAALGVCALLLLGHTATQQSALHGPLFRWDVTEHAFALHAAGALDGLPQGSAVFTDYTSSAVVGFVGAERLRTYVDGRTPLYFDATDFAVAREMGRDGVALHNGLDRFRAHAAVVPRDSQVCTQLAATWTPVLVEPLYTTFVEQPTAAALKQLKPCGASYLAHDSCDEAAVRRDIAHTRSVGAESFADFLDAQYQTQCGAAPKPALAQLRQLAPDARPYARYFERVYVEALLRNEAYAEATEHMLAALDAHDLNMVKLLQLPAAGQLPLEAARRVLTRYVDLTADDADLGVRAALAEICARAGDEECARFHATRAAVRGRTTSALAWLAEHHSDERVRRDAAHWLTLLGHPERSASATD